MMRRLILITSFPLYPIIRVDYETYPFEQYRWYANQQGGESGIWNNVRRNRARTDRLTGEPLCLPTMLRLT